MILTKGEIELLRPGCVGTAKDFLDTLDAQCKKTEALKTELRRERKKWNDEAAEQNNILAATVNEREFYKVKAARLKEALREKVCVIDPMSYHGEAMLCELCGSQWNNGAKRNSPATPETHKTDCLLAKEPK